MIRATGYRQLPDERDKRYPLAALMGAESSRPVSKVWKAGPVLDQGPTSSCVGHACFQLQVSEPVVRPRPPLSPYDIYGEARKIDEWTDNDDIDQGTSVRAGLMVLKNHGLIRGFYWAEDAEQCLEFILKFGPLVLGIRWTDSMMNPDSMGLIRPVGRGGSGHAIMAYAAHWKQKTIKIRNSWGDWGQGGDCIIELSDLDRLLSEPGACAAAVEE